MHWMNEWKSPVLAQHPGLLATTLLPSSHPSPQEAKNFTVWSGELKQ